MLTKMGVVSNGDWTYGESAVFKEEWASGSKAVRDDE